MNRKGEEITYKIGNKVTCNGYPGTIVEVCSGQLAGMFVVRLASGIVCVDKTHITAR